MLQFSFCWNDARSRNNDSAKVVVLSCFAKFKEWEPIKRPLTHPLCSSPPVSFFRVFFSGVGSFELKLVPLHRDHPSTCIFVDSTRVALCSTLEETY